MVKELLERYYGFREFRPGQEDVINSIIAGHDTLALMPTGGGKSLCFQLPALVFEKITLIISPLIALMKDQVDALQKRGVKASFINSSLSEEEIAKRTNDLLRGKARILYIAPERLNSDFAEHLRRSNIRFVAIDEAHCVSTWGHDFRPDYLVIKQCIDSFPSRPIVAAFTATATPEVRRDIIERLGLRNPQVFIRGFDRPNLRFFTRAWMNEYSRDKEVLQLIKTLEKPGIVYVGRRDKTVYLAEYLSQEGVLTLPYHAGLKPEVRTRTQDMFMKGEVSVIVATIAFGMGVDKADIRFVVHAGMPGTLEGYYQEAGRAGRDGKRADCVLLHSGEDSALQSYFINKNYEDSLKRGKLFEEAVMIRNMKYEKLQLMERYVMARECRRNIILNYFGDFSVPRGSNCAACDFCLERSLS